MVEFIVVITVCSLVAAYVVLKNVWCKCNFQLRCLIDLVYN